jgi:predicted transcriptional regulator
MTINIQINKSEKKVLTLLREYMEKYRTFNMKKVMSYLSHRIKFSSINLNTAGIENILKRLVEKNFIVEGSKLLREEVLENSIRKQIYEYILANPGIHFRGLLRDLDLSNHVVVWHINVLEKFEFIKRAEIENREIYYEGRFLLNDIKKQYYLSKQKSQQIIQFLQSHKKSYTKTKLAKQLGMHFNTISKYLAILMEYGIVEMKTKGRSKLYSMKNKS